MRVGGRSIIYILFVLMLATACQSDRSAYIIDDDDMEDLLYDVYRAHFTYKDGEDSRQDGAYQYALFLKILEKHDVTQAQWDSSMVYYCRHANDLQNIYKNLNERLEMEAESIGASVGESGDSTNIWHGDSNIMLMSYKPYTTRQWSIPVDTILEKGETLTLKFTGLFLQMSEVQRAECIFAMTLQNDSVVFTNQTISRTGNYNLRLSDTEKLGIKKINGMFMMHMKNANNFGTTSSDKYSSQVLCIRDVKLLHERPKETVTSSTTVPASNDGLPTKQQNTTDSAVNIIETEKRMELPPAQDGHLMKPRRMINN